MGALPQPDRARDLSNGYEREDEKRELVRPLAAAKDFPACGVQPSTTTN